MALVKLNLSADRKTLQQFGYISLIFFGGLGVYMVFGGQPMGWIGVGGGLACGAMARMAPMGLHKIYVGLMVISYPIGFVVSHVILAAIYYGVLTPVGLVMRIVNYDPMKRRIEPSLATYWEPREPRVDPRSYFRQY